MVHFVEINQASSPYSMLQHIGRVATLKLVPRNCLRYLQTTLIMGGESLVSEFMWGIVGTKFQYWLSILIFWTEFVKKVYFCSRAEKVNTFEFLYQIIQTSPGTKFQLKLTVFYFLDQICQKGVFPFKNGKSEHLHWVPHIKISLGNKFKLKLAILIFWTKFAQREYFWLKTETVNIANEFCIFEFFP